MSPTTCFISTQIRHRIATVAIRQDALIWVHGGTKTIQTADRAHLFKGGEAVVLPHGTTWDVVNDPLPHGRYEARVLLFGDPALRYFHESYAADFPGHKVNAFARIAVDSELAEAIRRCTDTLATQASPRLSQHRILEVLILLAERGCVLRPRESLSLPDQLRGLISQRPQADWGVEPLAQAFHMSASTLRRRLEPFGTSASELVREVRLETALTLLQSSPMSVGAVAQHCGYASHSRFTAAFRARYGFAPSDLRDTVTSRAADLHN